MNKRFELEYDDNCYKCIVDCENKTLYTDKKQVIDLLNNLNEEIEYWKQVASQGSNEINVLDHKLNNKRILLNDELRGLFDGYMLHSKSLSEKGIVTMIFNDIYNSISEVFE